MNKPMPAHNIGSYIPMIDGPETPPSTAVVIVQDGAGNTLRRRARGSAPDEHGTRLSLDFTDTSALADEIAAFGPAVRVVSPPHLVDAVVRRLRGALDRNRAA